MNNIDNLNSTMMNKSIKNYFNSCPGLIAMPQASHNHYRRGGIYQLPHANNIVLNIGGQRFQIKKSTLKNIADTRLSNLDECSESYDPINKDYFFDRSPQFFDSILNYFRTGQLHFSHCCCGPVIKLELEYWGIDENSISTCCWGSFKHHDIEKR